MISSAPPDTRTAHASAHAFSVLAGDEPAIGVAVSGGSDSLALLLHAHAWARDKKRRLHAATVDHGLRPEATAEARTVAAICTRLDVPHQILTWRPPAQRVAQSAARAARYDLLSTWAERHGFASIAIGHTRDDRLETFLIRARAGSGWYGLAGPMPAAPAPSTPHITRLIRPLLACTRKTLRDDLDAAGLPWIDDPSNQLPRYERVRMRLLLAQTSAATANSIIDTMNRLAQLRAATLAAARTTLAEHAAWSGPDLALTRAAFTALGPEARLRLLEAVILSIAPRPTPPRHDRLLNLCQRLADPSTTRAATLAGCWFRPDSRRIRISLAPPRASANRPGAPSTPSRLASERACAYLAEPCAHLLRK